MVNEDCGRVTGGSWEGGWRGAWGAGGAGGAGVMQLDGGLKVEGLEGGYEGIAEKCHG